MVENASSKVQGFLEVARRRIPAWVLVAGKLTRAAGERRRVEEEHAEEHVVVTDRGIDRRRSKIETLPLLLLRAVSSRAPINRRRRAAASCFHTTQKRTVGGVSGLLPPRIGTRAAAWKFSTALLLTEARVISVCVETRHSTKICVLARYISTIPCPTKCNGTIVKKITRKNHTFACDLLDHGFNALSREMGRGGRRVTTHGGENQDEQRDENHKRFVLFFFFLPIRRQTRRKKKRFLATDWPHVPPRTANAREEPVDPSATLDQRGNRSCTKTYGEARRPAFKARDYDAREFVPRAPRVCKIFPRFLSLCRRACVITRVAIPRSLLFFFFYLASRFNLDDGSNHGTKSIARSLTFRCRIFRYYSRSRLFDIY